MDGMAVKRDARSCHQQPVVDDSSKPTILLPTTHHQKTHVIQEKDRNDANTPRFPNRHLFIHSIHQHQHPPFLHFFLHMQINATEIALGNPRNLRCFNLPKMSNIKIGLTCAFPARVTCRPSPGVFREEKGTKDARS